MEKTIARTLFILGASILTLCGYLLWKTWWGDSAIYLVYARNIARGDLMTFSPGEFSSGATGPLWAFLLSVGFMFGPTAGVNGAKLLGLLFSLSAFGAVYAAGRRFSMSSMGAIVSALSVMPVLLFSILIYETGAAITLLTIFLYALKAVIDGKRRRTLLWLSAVGVSFLRPDALLLVYLGYATLLLKYRDKRSELASIAFIGVLTFLPIGLFWLYSYLHIGYISTSMVARSFALRETASYLGKIRYSFAPLKLFVSKGQLVFSVMALFGVIVLYRRHDIEDRWFAAYAVGGVGGYLLLTILVSPVTHGVSRYFAVLSPILALLIGVSTDYLITALQGRTRQGVRSVGHTFRKLTAFILLGLVCLLPFYRVAHSAILMSRQGFTFEVITEKNVMQWLCSITRPNDTILLYEVQDAFWCDQAKILSLDGIIDGKVIPYLYTGDLTAFLKRYQPRYWVANDAVQYRPVFRHSILARAVQCAGAREGASCEIDGIRFTNLRVSDEKEHPGFAQYRQVFLLEYEDAVKKR